MEALWPKNLRPDAEAPAESGLASEELMLLAAPRPAPVPPPPVLKVGLGEECADCE